MRRWLLVSVLTAMASCSSDEPATAPIPAAEQLVVALSTLAPATLVPGSTIRIGGADFVSTGATALRLRGTFSGADVDISLEARFIDSQHLEADWPGAAAAGLAAPDGIFEGEATVSTAAEDLSASSGPLAVVLDMKSQLEPRFDSLQEGVIFVNDQIVVSGDGLLLGGNEGETVAVVEGCFQPQGSTSCEPVDTAEIPLQPSLNLDRTTGSFAFEPRISGIHPGTFEGMVTLRNHHGAAAGSIQSGSDTRSATYDIQPSAAFYVKPEAASLGQYVDVYGGGFVGSAPGSVDPQGAVTTLELEGMFQVDGSSVGTSVVVHLVPEFVTGRLVRYVLNEQDELGKSIDLRTMAGTFTGRIRPIVQYGNDTLEGEGADVEFAISHVKQVVWINFLPSYVESLRHFGLRAMDQQVRERVMTVAKRDYAGINAEFRLQRPEDFAHFTQVDISGPDPNGYGLLGYDNTPGKDVNNSRLYDKIGGVNALTQEDGYPGYGGVFVESLFGFSEHPGAFAKSIDGADPMFDRIFDPFRPDLGAAAVTTQDLASSVVPVLTDGAACPGSDRPMQIACAVFVLGSMIGTTMTHEVAHSLGLADPFGGEFHNVGDQPNRLMDSGGNRTFFERAELQGQGPAVFCDEDHAYLRKILPAPGDNPAVARPHCW